MRGTKAQSAVRKKKLRMAVMERRPAEGARETVYFDAHEWTARKDKESRGGGE